MVRCCWRPFSAPHLLQREAALERAQHHRVDPLHAGGSQQRQMLRLAPCVGRALSGAAVAPLLLLLLLLARVQGLRIVHLHPACSLAHAQPVVVQQQRAHLLLELLGKESVRGQLQRVRDALQQGKLFKRNAVVVGREDCWHRGREPASCFG